MISNLSDYDSLTIYAGNSKAKPKLEQYCGMLNPLRQIFKTDVLFLHFHSDWYGTSRGFKLEYHPHSKLH